MDSTSSSATATSAPVTNISAQGVDFIKKREIFKPKLYDDPLNATVGYGHLVHMGKISGLTSEKPFSQGISEKQATQLMMADLQTYVRAVRQSVHVALKQNEFDALVSFTYNVGPGGLRKSALLRYVNGGQGTLIGQAFLHFVGKNPKTIKGLTNRRKAEANLYLNGVY